MAMVDRTVQNTWCKSQIEVFEVHVKSSQDVAESTHLAKNILARLRDRAQNVSDEAESSRKKRRADNTVSSNQ